MTNGPYTIEIVCDYTVQFNMPAGFKTFHNFNAGVPSSIFTFLPYTTSNVHCPVEKYEVTDDSIGAEMEYYAFDNEYYIVNYLYVHYPTGVYSDDSCRPTPSIPCLKVMVLTEAPKTYKFYIKITAEGDAILKSPEIQVLVGCT